MERARVDRDDRVSGGDAPVNDQALSAFDRHGQRGRVVVGGQPSQQRLEVVLGVTPVQQPTIVPAASRTVTAWLVLAQSHPMSSKVGSIARG
jgi:hypothetical protein